MAKIGFAKRSRNVSMLLKPSEILITTKSKHEWYFMCVTIVAIQYWYKRLKTASKFITFSSVLKFATDDIKDCSKDISHKKDYPLTPWK